MHTLLVYQGKPLQKALLTFDSADDVALQNGELAYGWANCITLAAGNQGRNAADNKAYKNCDSQAFFAIGR